MYHEPLAVVHLVIMNNRVCWPENHPISTVASK